MVPDHELDAARASVLAFFVRQRRDLTPREVIASLTSARLPEDLIRLANIALVASGDLEITPEFKLHLVRRFAGSHHSAYRIFSRSANAK